MDNELKNWFISQNAELPNPNPHFAAKRWDESGRLLDYSQPDFDEVFQLDDTASVKLMPSRF